MISGIDLSQVVEYSLKDDKENPTIWKLGIIPSSIMAKIMKDAQAPDKQVDVSIAILKIGLKGWENFNQKFEKVKEQFYGYECEVVPLSLLDTIPVESIIELSTKIIEINNLTGQEIKN